LPTLTLLAGNTALLALVRWHNRPVGLVRLKNAAPNISPESLRSAIQAQVQVSKEPISATTELRQRTTIIVCTRERPEDLRRCLLSLLSLAAEGHEVLVVDNAPLSNRTAEVVKGYPFRYLVEPRPGLNNARNCGWRAATYSIVAYLDDDTRADRDWIGALIQPFAVPEVAGVTGLVLPLELETPAQEQFEIYCWQRRNFEWKVFIAPQTQPAAAGVVGMGANMAFRREVLQSLGGFDPRLDAGTATCSGGDTDMFARILEAGHHLVYTPAALVWHRHRREQAELRHCIFGYGVGLYSFLTKRLVENQDPQALITAVRWFAGPLLKAARRRLSGQPAVSLDLLLLEAGGACLGAFRFWQEHQRMAKTIYLSRERFA
jgi:GT2 family glycosyltransferase